MRKKQALPSPRPVRNLTGLSPCRNADAVRSQFGADFPVLDEAVGQAQNPSEIRDLLTNQLFRQG